MVKTFRTTINTLIASKVAPRLISTPPSGPEFVLLLIFVEFVVATTAKIVCIFLAVETPGSIVVAAEERGGDVAGDVCDVNSDVVISSTIVAAVVFINPRFDEMVVLVFMLIG